MFANSKDFVSRAARSALQIARCLLLLLYIRDILIQPNCLLAPIKSTVKSCEPACCSYVFGYGVFCIPILSTFEDIRIVSRYCLKFLVRKNCAYCIKGALMKTICASSVTIAFTALLDLKNVFISVSNVHFIFMSILTGKLIFLRSQKYLRGILYTNLLRSEVANFIILSSMLSSVLSKSVLLL